MAISKPRAAQPDQNDLALERTHASWLRTALAFIVALLASRHYLPDAPWMLASVLGAGGFYSSVNAGIDARDIFGKAVSLGLAVSSIAAVLIHVTPPT